MKRIMICVLSTVILFTSLISLSSCTRRGEFEDILESQKESESLGNVIEVNDNIIGKDITDYKTPVMLKTGNTPFYEGKTIDELEEIFKTSDRHELDITLIPTGRIYDGNDAAVPYFYNKVTGNFSNWCADPLCEWDECIWQTGTMFIQYASERYMYFMAEIGLDNYGLFRCDLQRNNIEKIRKVPVYKVGKETYRDEVDVVYEKGDDVYIRWLNYAGEKAVCTLSVFNTKTKEEKIISGDINLQYITIVNDTIFYSTREDYYTLYKTDLSFGKTELLGHYVISQFNNRYLILHELDEEGQGFTNWYYSYNLETGELFKLNNVSGNKYLSGDYLYYGRFLTPEEIEKEPLADYYNYIWKSKAAGKIYRVHVGIESAQEECVFQLTYKDIPVRICDFDVDGDVIYVTFNNHETYENFYNQDFNGDETLMVRHCLVDLQNGTVTMLELPKEE